MHGSWFPVMVCTQKRREVRAEPAMTDGNDHSKLLGSDLPDTAQCLAPICQTLPKSVTDSVWLQSA
eukprot:1158521-Pelagomonas_calceolata.AAC.1